MEFAVYTAWVSGSTASDYCLTWFRYNKIIFFNTLSCNNTINSLNCYQLRPSIQDIINPCIIENKYLYQKKTC